MLSNYFISLIRTWVPIGVGAVAAWLLAHGLGMDAATQTGLIVGLTAALSGVYYAVVRAIEQKFPWVGGVLLGHTAKPVYVPEAKA